MAVKPNIISALLSRLAPRLRFPQLFALTAWLFLLDLLIPDLIPFVDEIILGLATLLLGAWKTKQEAQEDDEDVIITEATVVDDQKQKEQAAKDRSSSS